MLDGTWTAIIFLILGLLLLLGEITVPGFFIAVPGGTLIFMGAIGLLWPSLMFDSPWSWALWPLAAVAATLVNLYAYKRWAPPGRHPITLGKDSLPGHEGVVTRDVEPGSGVGKVSIKGQTWSARAAVAIPAGAQVRVLRVEGVHVVVEPT